MRIDRYIYIYIYTYISLTFYVGVSFGFPEMEFPCESLRAVTCRRATLLHVPAPCCHMHLHHAVTCSNAVLSHVPEACCLMSSRRAVTCLRAVLSHVALLKLPTNSVCDVLNRCSNKGLYISFEFRRV